MRLVPGTGPGPGPGSGMKSRFSVPVSAFSVEGGPPNPSLRNTRRAPSPELTISGNPVTRGLKASCKRCIHSTCFGLSRFHPQQHVLVYPDSEPRPSSLATDQPLQPCQNRALRCCRSPRAKSAPEPTGMDGAANGCARGLLSVLPRELQLQGLSGVSLVPGGSPAASTAAGEADCGARASRLPELVKFASSVPGLDCLQAICIQRGGCFDTKFVGKSSRLLCTTLPSPLQTAPTPPRCPRGIAPPRDKA